MSEWDKGYNDGYSKAYSLGRFFKTEDFPATFQHRGSHYDRGYAEGVISGQGKWFDEKYPGNKGFSKGDDGKLRIYYPKGHPALNKE